MENFKEMHSFKVKDEVYSIALNCGNKLASGYYNNN